MVYTIGMTIKQKIFVTEYLKNRNGTKAAKKAYKIKSESVASTIAHENLKRPNIQEAVSMAMLKHDLTLDKALVPIAKSLRAKKVIQIEGDYFETDVDDLDLQLKGSDRVLKLMGINQNNNNSTVIFTEHLNNNQYNL